MLLCASKYNRLAAWGKRDVTLKRQANKTVLLFGIASLSMHAQQRQCTQKGYHAGHF